MKQFKNRMQGAANVLWKSVKRRLYACCLMMIFLLGMGEVRAQQEYFVFIQEPAGQPFYVRMGEESHSSSAIGHLILPSLRDSTYRMFIGFPRSRYPEQMFNIEVSGDRGFELRMIDGKWQLFDLNSMQTVQPVVTRRLENMVRKEDEYSRLMAGVVRDSAVMYTKLQDTVIADSTMENAPKTQVVQSPANTNVKKAAADTTAVKTEMEKPVAATTNANGLPLRDPRDIIRYRTENVVGGKLMIYLDRTGVVTDTISIIVPR